MYLFQIQHRCQYIHLCVLATGFFPMFAVVLLPPLDQDICKDKHNKFFPDNVFHNEK